jgi:photosystem II stability/assembly factor-like uncharacterized protein
MRTVRRSERALLFLAPLFLLAIASIPLRAQGEDPDIPSFLAGRISKGDYLKLRSEQIGLMRGIPHSLAYDPRVKAMNEMSKQVMGSLAKVSSTGWTPIGPSPIPNGQVTGGGPVSGRVTAIAVHPTDPNIVYAGTAQGGVYRTIDGGSHWTPIFDNAASLAIGAVTIDPLNPSTVFVGTGEGNQSLDSFFGIGLYRIDNANTSPTLNGPFELRVAGTGTTASSGHAFYGTSITKIVVDPANDNRIFVSNVSGASGLSGNGVCCGGTAGFLALYFSSDALSSAVTFSRVNISTFNGLQSVTDLLFEPGSSDNLLIGVEDLGGLSLSGVYRSTNASVAAFGSPGVTPAFTRVLTTGAVTIKLDINKVGSTVTALAASDESSGTLRKSVDGGATWPTTLASATGFCDGQCWYDMVPALNPKNAGTILLGGSAAGTSSIIVHRSTNGGTSFSAAETGLHADVHAIVFSPSDTTVVYTGNDGGIWKSTNAGVTWASLNNSGFNATQFQSIALHPTDANFSIGGTQDNGTNMYTPLQTWNRIDFGDGGYAEIDQNAADVTNVTMYHTYFNQSNNLAGYARVTSVGSATDGSWGFFGCSGNSPANGITCADAVLFYAPMTLGPGNPNSVYYGTDRLYRSIDMGANNTVVSQAPLVAGVPISSIAISPQDDNFRIVGLRNGALFYTTTGNSVMSVLDAIGGTGVVPDKYVARAAFDPGNKNTAYITLDGYMGGTGPTQSHVWKVTNLGTTPAITAINSGLPDVPVNAFVVDPTSSNNLFAGTDIGVYNSTDGGTSWNVYGTGLPVVAVFDMAIQKITHTLRVATHGRGMWENSGPPLPIQLASLTGTAVSGQGVMLQWSTLSETDSYGFEVQRSVTQTGGYVSLPGSFVHGHGTSTVMQKYSYTDNSAGTGTVYYRLKQLDLDGTFRYSDGIGVDVASGAAGKEFPTEFSLSQSYPNPFNPSTNIRYGLPQKAVVRLDVFSTLGQRVATLVNEQEDAGYHDVAFNAGRLASGTYFYTITAGDYHASKKLLLLK